MTSIRDLMKQSTMIFNPLVQLAKSWHISMIYYLMMLKGQIGSMTNLLGNLTFLYILTGYESKSPLNDSSPNLYEIMSLMILSNSFAVLSQLNFLEKASALELNLLSHVVSFNKEIAAEASPIGEFSLTKTPVS